MLVIDWLQWPSWPHYSRTVVWKMCFSSFFFSFQAIFFLCSPLSPVLLIGLQFFSQQESEASTIFVELWGENKKQLIIECYFLLFTQSGSWGFYCRHIFRFPLSAHPLIATMTHINIHHQLWPVQAHKTQLMYILLHLILSCLLLFFFLFFLLIVKSLSQCSLRPCSPNILV